MIKIYASTLPGEPEEIHECDGVTVHDWLTNNVPDYKFGPTQPISCAINGELVNPLHWADTEIRQNDCVELRVMPKGGAIAAAWAWVVANWVYVAAAISVVGGVIMGQRVGGVGARAAGERGERINPADARSNRARLGEQIPELFGTYIRYPDYLSQPRKYFVDKRTQALDMLICVGKGYYQIDPDNIRIGNTPLTQLGTAVAYQLLDPGEDVTGHPAHRNWYNSPEVGSTKGTSGIRLLGISGGDQDVDMTVTSSGDTLSFTVPETWLAEMIFSTVDIEQEVHVELGTPRDILTGDFQHLAEGMDIEISGGSDIDGIYTVFSIDSSETEITLDDSDGQPVTGLAAGDPNGNHYVYIDRVDARYRSTEKTEDSVTFKRILPDGTDDPTWSEFPSVTDAQAHITVDPDTPGFWSGPFEACPEGETTDTIEWDVFASQGLGEISGSSIAERTRTIELQYREVGTEAWTSVFHDITGDTRDQLGWTFSTTLSTKMRPEIRARRTTPEDVSTTSLDRLEWLSLRSELPHKTSYDGVTTLALTIVGTEQIASQSENQINMEATRILPPVDGGASAPSRSIADAAMYIAKSIGYTENQIDMDELQRLDDIWQSRGDTFDYVFSGTTVRDAINTVLQAGYAELTIAGGIITPVRDEVRTQFEQSYSPENMTGTLKRQFDSRRVDDPDGVEVEYTDATTWTTETVLCLLPGDEAVKLDKIKIEGVTDRTRAWRIGMRRRRAQRYRRWSYNFETELDALNSNYLSYVPLIDDVPGYGKVSILRSIESVSGGAKLTVSEPMEWIDGETHVVAYRDAYGELSGPYNATMGNTDYEIIADIPTPWPDLSARQEPPHVYFGTSTRWNFPALITEISPSGQTTAEVQAVNYDERVYADDNNTPY